MNRRVLLIDDEIDNIEIIQVALRHENYEFFSATDPFYGLDLFHEKKPAVILLDLRMPSMDGIDFLQELGKIPEAMFSVVILTGHGTDEDVKKCYELGASGFLRKPVDIIELRGLVRNLVELENNKRELLEHRFHLAEMVAKKTERLNHEIARRKAKQEELENSRKLLEEKQNSLEEKNAALRAILDHMELEKENIRQNIAHNIEETVIPLVESLKNKASKKQIEQIELIENQIRELPYPTNSLVHKYAILSPREIEVTNLIKDGFSSSEISGKLDISLETVNKHRYQIRKKFGLSNRRINLRSYLLELK